VIDNKTGRGISKAEGLDTRRFVRSTQQKRIHLFTSFMSRLTGQDVYGLFEPRYARDPKSIDTTPVRDRLPYILSADELPLFQHPKIDANIQIRLITLLPAERPPHGSNSREPLRCHIEVHALTQAPPYEALSYTWGDIDRSLPITVVRIDEAENEVEEALFATPQLLLALRRIRRATPRCLWIDQLCIDQENSEEKGPQIQLMGDVYRTAMRVVIWLGEDVENYAYEKDKMLTEKDSEHISNLISSIVPQSPGPGHDAATVAGQMIDFRSTYHFEWIGMRRLRAAIEMLSRPWFQRAWVFQEASLARDLLVQFAQQEFRFEDLKLVFDAILLAAKRTEMHRKANSSLRMATPGYEIMDIIQKTRMEVLGNPDSAPASTAHSRFLVKLFQVLRRVKCFKQQDLIFAFLAFQESEGIRATHGVYEQPVEETWRYAAERIIQTSKCLEIFAALPGTLSDMPSWAPNWGNCFPYSRPIAAPGNRFNANRGRTHVWELCDDPKKLKVRGKIIDRVQDVTHLPFGLLQQWPGYIWLYLGWEVILQWANGILFSHAGRLGNYLPVKQGNLARDMCRTVLADGTLGREQPLRNVHRYVEAILATRNTELREPGRLPLESEKPMFEDCEKLEDLVLVSEMKRVFYTKHVQLGMATAAAQVGDCVAILHGSQVPCLLRKAKGGDNEYMAVSQCYLDGWMYDRSPKETFVEGNEKVPHPGADWFKKAPDDFVLV
jgi:hypothetical protein